MSDYTATETKGEDGTKKIEMDVSPELKDVLLGKFSSGPLPFMKPPEPKIISFDVISIRELEEVDKIKKEIRQRLTEYPIRYCKLILKQLWLEIKDFPEIGYEGQYSNIPVGEFKEENLDS